MDGLKVTKIVYKPPFKYNYAYCPRRLTDKPQDCGSCNVGSIPAGDACWRSTEVVVTEPFRKRSSGQLDREFESHLLRFVLP